MPTPLLATKLFIPPPRPRTVARPRLIARLNEGLHGKLTLISAPAGFGKTTLVSEWLATPGRPPTAWLSLDARDSDPARFVAYLVAALQTVVPGMGESVLAALQSPLPQIESLLTALLNEIAAIPTDFILVLDDYHALDSTAVDQAVVFLLEHMPPHMHLVITTREDPQLPLPRLRVRGQMTEVRAADLRFTPAEAAGFLNQVMGLDLSADEVNALESRTEGWVAALQLAALSMRGRADVTRFVKDFAGDNRYIVDYLVEEVLQRQPPRVRNFLLQTSILEQLSGPLCDAVTGQQDSMAILDALERGNLFVVPLDDQRHWFRYHHLFAEVLVDHARLEQPAQIPILHQRASAWYAEQGRRAEAIRHALAAQDFERAAALIELAWPAMDGSFQSATWLSWAKALPDALVRARPVLSVAYSWAHMNVGELEAAEARLLEGERWLENSATHTEQGQAMIVADENQFRALPASIATARSYMAQAHGNLPASLKYGQAALDFLPADDHLRRGPAAALLSLAYWANGDLEAAYDALDAAMSNFQKSGNFHFGISGTYGLADIRITQGRLHDATQVYRHVLHLALAHGEPLLRGTAELYLGLSEIYREQGDAEVALHNLQQSAALGERAGLPDWGFRHHRAQARFQQIAGDLAGALASLDQAQRHYRPNPVPDVCPLAAMQARVWLAQGRLSEARRWAHARNLAVDDALTFLREFEHITLARLLLAEFDRDGDAPTLDKAIALLDRLQQAAAAGGRWGSVIEISVLQALAYQAQGNLAPAFAALERALRRGEPEGYVRVFVDAGTAMARLLSTATSQGILREYVAHLLTYFPPAESPAPAPPLPHYAASSTQTLVEPLSARELEILQLVAQGLSNEEIATRLFLALSTVKGHNQNIFGKLQVQRRTEAIVRARQLGLL